ncbi:MAG: hypothetical protein KKC29_03865 [Alphaproteobacteria bacterium]|jgi:hypothetical protein|nr:hypothetical protein [Alphaproteobacteria bacterium]MBU2043143.1 hypothetical protein [Alphaproteobacteria bacterium]MBU2124473.1 hypothetical protein [Alphaproteobacteria bacterium]MBU2207677.1 hypothetical protein [Alphaproteobacteria bacterium]MBU2290218.1 hypothetical protein [Alphaproteobacteria bacterium]
MRAFLFSLLLLLGACATAPAPAADPSGDSLDAIARDYVALILEIGEREPGYVDAYYGPAEWQAAASADPRTVPQLIQGAAGLTARLNAVPTRGADPAVAQRRAYLLAHVSAAAARLRMRSGDKMGFADEAEALFGIRPELRPLASFDPVLAEIDALLPGEGTLTERVTAFKADYVIPRDRLQAVMDAAIAECRARTVRHIALPAHERFTLSFVGDKPWSGYNYYLGDAASRIEINADLPIYTERAIDLGCHEAYPGHHVYNALLEQTFVRERGWVEMSVYPLFSPMSFVAEGSANYGIDLAFPGDEAAAWEREVLFPLAGLDPATAAKKARLAALTRQLARAEYTIADDWLAGRIDRAEAIRRLMTYTLADEARATQRLRFIDTYRSYIINYGLGRDVVQAWVERQGLDRWAAMETLLSSQILPADLVE